MIGKIKLIFWLVVLLIVAYFVSMNTETRVSVNILPPDFRIEDVPLALVIIFSAILGGLVILIFAVTDWLAYKIDKLKIKRQLNLLKSDYEDCQKENKKLEEENNKFKAELETLKEQLAKCNEEKEKFSKEIEELKEENGILNQKVDILIDQLDRLEKEKKGEQENGSV